ncbi:hypothetical protein MRB53_038359 [Persea americana]|nr:hypothetical protein MRB53_038359 [Persea americana]
MLSAVVFELTVKILVLFGTTWVARAFAAEYLDVLLDAAQAFADVHYYFSENRSPSKPQHHRFDRQSYIYLFHNPSRSEAKLEIANHAGTADQDAFSGSLNIAKVRNSHLQPNLFSVTVNLREIQNRESWHLPAYNEKNEKNAGFSPRAPRFHESCSATIRKDRNQRPFPSKSVKHRLHKLIPGPPTPATSTGPSQAAPAAYNPAAPAAPEPVTYREKTPPPIDDGTGTGLKAASKYDIIPPAPSYGPSPTHYQASSATQPTYFSGPPRQPSNASLPGPPTSRPQQPSSAPSFGPLAASTISPAPSAPPAYTQGIGLPPPPPPPAPAAAGHEAPPVGGYSNYSYSAAQSGAELNAHGAYTGDVHSQLYRPSEEEAGAHGHHHAPRRRDTGEGKSKMEEASIAWRARHTRPLFGGAAALLDGNRRNDARENLRDQGRKQQIQATEPRAEKGSKAKPAMRTGSWAAGRKQDGPFEIILSYSLVLKASLRLLLRCQDHFPHAKGPIRLHGEDGLLPHGAFTFH